MQQRLGIYIALLQRFRTACASSGAGIDILQAKGEAFFFPPQTGLENFEAAVHGCQSRSSGSSSLTACKEHNAPLTKNLQGQAEETLMSQAFGHLAVNVPRARSEQCMCVWKKIKPRLDIHAALL